MRLSNRRQRSPSGIGLAVVGLGIVGAATAGALYAVRRRGLPSDEWQVSPSFTEADVEAAARMVASENPHGDLRLHIEQIYAELRARRPGQSLFDRITGGAGWGRQVAPRPVATTNAATDAQRDLARRVLSGVYSSTLPGARKFFEPGQQDKAFAIAERARKKQSAGETLTEQEQRLLSYHHDADGIRRKWTSEGSKFVGTVDGVEFFT